MIPFQRVVIIGMGLIGGSIALALRKAGYEGEIIGCDSSRQSLEEAEAIGAIDQGYQDLGEGVKEVDLVILAVPLGYYRQVLKEIAESLPKDVVVTDVGSVKGCVEEIISQELSQSIQFVGGHPMTGSEKGGFHAASPFLYENAYYFLTPNPYTKEETIEGLKDFVKLLGAFPVVVETKQHDEIVALISHIPHLAAVLLANMLDRKNSISYIPFVGGGFRDTTRIAAGNPKMWQDIFFYNKKEILEGIDTLGEMLQEFKVLLQDDESEEVLENLQRAKLIRDSIPHTSRDYIPPLYDLIIDVGDRPGVLGELTQIMGKNNINIKEIEILHAREGETGAIRIALASKTEEEKALHVLKQGGFSLTYRKGEGQDVGNK
ncbi:Prephenate dehydrogenase [Alkaliphilus metalliredigens QYMF]|uniref:Prephenate dehydrogenase n=1 Tax=Alkaliphilus metalliredigens (strain QYMF) TaxID=293826 RepID=A6TL03_ALKMQ|nr:prephenate dehydrogenase [Alkaliphilus metalliredigens]ABR46871.1 Prephenate dehydrogenase [Alkaliphilus metalliredigens QYMF]